MCCSALLLVGRKLIKHLTKTLCGLSSVYLLLWLAPITQATQAGNVTEYPLPWVGEASGSTHELIFDVNDARYLWVTGQDFDS